MSAISVRDLQRHAVEVLRRIEAGEEIELRSGSRLIAKIVPVPQRRPWLPAAEIGTELARLGPDNTGLTSELRAALADTTGTYRS